MPYRNRYPSNDNVTNLYLQIYFHLMVYKVHVLVAYVFRSIFCYQITVESDSDTSHVVKRAKFAWEGSHQGVLLTYKSSTNNQSHILAINKCRTMNSIKMQTWPNMSECLAMFTNYPGSLRTPRLCKTWKPAR